MGGRRRWGTIDGDVVWDLLHIITKLELGGAQLATLYEIEHSRFATGERYLAFGPGGLLDRRAQELGDVRCFAIEALGRHVDPTADGRAMLAIAALVRRLKHQRPSGRLLVHTHSSKAGVVGRIGAWLGGADCVVHSVHGFGHSHHGHGPVRRILLTAERLAGRFADGFTADSLANVREGERDRLFFGKPVRVVRCGVELARFAPDPVERERTRARLDISPDALVVMTLACLKPQKDPLSWARVASHVLRAEPRAVFLLAGDGELRTDVERVLDREGLRGRARLLGWRDDAAALLHASDLFLLTSRWEGLPQAIVQAMAAGVPVVATDVDGNREAVLHGDNGLLFAPGAVDDLAGGVLSLLGDPERRRRMGARGLASARPFSADEMVRDLDDFYRELTESQPGARGCVIQ